MLEKRTYKNWKEICAVMGWDATKGGNNKIALLKELDTLCKYHKSGHSFIIDKVYENVIPSLSSGKLSKDIQLLLLNILYESDEEVFDITNNNLMVLLNMVNPKYKEYYSRKNKLADKLMLDKGYCYEVYNIMSRYKTTIKNAIDDLSKKKLLTYSIIDMICYDKEVCEYVGDKQVNKVKMPDFREPTVEESKLILEIEKEELSKLNLKSVKDLYYRPKEYEIYVSNVSERLKEHDINYKFKTYRLIYNKKYIKEELIMNKEEMKKIKQTLNDNIFDSTVKTIKNKKESISDEICVDLYSKKELVEKFNIYNKLPYENCYIDNCMNILLEICKSNI